MSNKENVDKTNTNNTQETAEDISTQKNTENAENPLETTENTEIETSDQNNKWSNKKITIIFLITIIISAVLGTASVYVLTPIKENSKAQAVLDLISRNSGDLTAVNTEITTFTGQKLETATIEQKSLKNGNTEYDSAVFIFNNGKNISDRKVLDVYIDFNSMFSRDFLVINHSSFKNLIESGKIELRVHPVPTGSAYSLYAAEALAEAFASQPDKAWDFMFELLNLSTTLDTNQFSDILDSITEVAHNNGLKEIDGETITKGIFASWIIKVGDDKKLGTGYYPPIAYIDGKEINPEYVNFNNSDDFKQSILE